MARVHEVLDSFEAEDENALFERAVRNNQREVTDALNSNLSCGCRKPQIQRGLNLGK